MTRVYTSLLLLFLAFATMADPPSAAAPVAAVPTASGDEAKRLQVKASITQKLAALFQVSRPPCKDRKAEAEWWNFRFLLQKAQYLLERYRPTAVILAFADEDLVEAEAILDALRKQHIPAPEPGLREEAYLAENDRSLQPFVRYLPPDYSPDHKYPLLVYLHGYSPYLNIVNWSELCEGLEDFAEATDACIIMPFGRSNTDFQGIGEQDVLRAIHEMCIRYSIDPDRIFMVGFSMGGMGALTIASHFPHLFAGMLIISGRGDYYFWHRIEKDRLPPPKQELVNREFASELLSNLAHLPTRMYHGTADTLIPVSEARHFAHLLKRGNPEFRYLEYDGQDHWITDLVFAGPEAMNMIKNRKRQFPETFTYRSWHPGYPRAWWLSITGFSDSPPYQIDVTKSADGLHFAGKNISSVIVDRSQMPESIRTLPLKPQGPLLIQEGKLDHAVPLQSASGPAGGVRDFFLKPFLFVDATGSTETTEPSEEALARSLQWTRFAKGEAQICKEGNLSDQEKRNFNLYLLGEPESSPMIRDALKSLSIQITSDSFVVNEGRFPRRGNGLLIFTRSPWNPEREIVLECGIPWGAHAPINHIFDSVPGFIVYSGEKDPLDPDGGNLALCSGFLDKQGKPVRIFIRKAAVPEK